VARIIVDGFGNRKLGEEFRSGTGFNEQPQSPVGANLLALASGKTQHHFGIIQEATAPCAFAYN
jgi:hypothetical protein